MDEPKIPSGGVSSGAAEEEEEPEPVRVVKSSKLFKDYTLPQLHFLDPEYFKTSDPKLHKVRILLIERILTTFSLTLY